MHIYAIYCIAYITKALCIKQSDGGVVNVPTAPE